MLAYRPPRDAKDEYLRISESKTIESMYRFCRVVVGKFRSDYLRGPNEKKRYIMAQNESWGFSKILGSISCTASHGRIFHFLGKVCTKGITDIVVWYLKLWQIMTYKFSTLFFCMTGYHNDINMR
jgi:hypothetical protein